MEKSLKTKKKFLQKLNYFMRYGKIKFLPEVNRAFHPLLWLTAGISCWHNFRSSFQNNVKTPVKPNTNICGVPGFGALEQL